MRTKIVSWLMLCVVGCILLLAGCGGRKVTTTYVPHKFGEPVAYKTNYFYPADGKILYFASEDELKLALSRVQAGQPASAPQ